VAAILFLIPHADLDLVREPSEAHPVPEVKQFMGNRTF